MYIPSHDKDGRYAISASGFDSSHIVPLLESPLFQAILESLSVGVAILDSAGVFLYANSAYISFHGGKNKSDYIGKYVRDLFISADSGVHQALKTKKRILIPSLGNDGIKGVCSRVPILDKQNKVAMVLTETLATNISQNHLNDLIKTLSDLTKKAGYYQHQAHQAIGHLHTFDTIISRSAIMAHLKKIGKKYAQTDNPILINGESGTGKELLAQALHSASPRAHKPFIAVNCAALPLSLIESELFGYTDGAFTGSRRAGMKGKFEAAHNGTIFLDEIGELPLDIQSKLLRVLESGEIQKIGQSAPTYSNFRLIAATNKNMNKMVQEGAFREDLYHRLGTLELTLPPLRQRREDIPMLATTLMGQILGPVRAGTVKVAQSCLDAFRAAEWKGNIREMKNILTAALCSLEKDEKVLKVSHLSPRFLATLPLDKTHARPKHEARNALREVSLWAEREAILTTLARCEGNCSKTARELGISRTKLYNKFKLHSIETGWKKQS